MLINLRQSDGVTDDPPNHLVLSSGMELMDFPLRASNEHISIFHTALKGVAEAALYCAH